MANWGRRDVLCGTITVLAGGAGCLEGGQLSEYDLEDREPNCGTSCEARNPETSIVRGSSRPIEFEGKVHRGYWASGPNLVGFRPERYLVWGEPFVDALAFADGDAGTDAEAFLRERSYGEESVVAVQFELGDCRRVDPAAVTWDDDGISLGLCVRLHDYETACATDTEEWVAVLVSVPDTLNPDAIDEYEVTADGECPGPSDADSENGTNDESASRSDGSNGDGPADDGSGIGDARSDSGSEPTTEGDSR